MTDRHDGFVVNIVFALGDVREDDAACIIDGIRQMKNVVAVEAAVFDFVRRTLVVRVRGEDPEDLEEPACVL